MSDASLIAGASLAILALGAGLQALRAVSLQRAWKLIRAHADEYSPLAVDDAASGDSSPGVTVLLPVSRSAGELVLDCVRACLSSRHPRREVIVICEGKGTADALGLTATFDLREARWLHPKRLKAAPTVRMLVSRSRAQLIVLEQDGSGRAEALNAGLELARNPLVCSIDVRTRIEKDALLRASAPMVEDESVLAVEGMMLPGYRAPGNPAALRGMVQRIDAIDSLRQAFIGKAAAAAFGVPPWLSSGFAMYRRDVIVALGGWNTQCDDPDAELGARLHRLAMPPMKGRIEFLAEPMGWRVSPERVSGIVSQWRAETRAAWDLRRRGLTSFATMRAAWRTLGWSGWVIAAATIGLGAASGVVAIEPVAWLAALYLTLGLIVSLAVLSMESMLKSRVERTTDRLLLMASALLWELLRPMAAFVSLHELLRARRLGARPFERQSVLAHATLPMNSPTVRAEPQHDHLA